MEECTGKHTAEVALREEESLKCVEGTRAEGGGIPEDDPAAAEEDFLSRLEKLEQEAISFEGVPPISSSSVPALGSLTSVATSSASLPSAPSSVSATSTSLGGKGLQLGSGGVRLFARDRPLEWRVFSADNYTFNEWPALAGKFETAPDSLQRRQAAYVRRGARQSVAAAILVHRFHFPHLLVFQSQSQKGEGAGISRPSLLSFKWRSWEKAPEALDRKLKNVILPQPERTRRGLQLQPSESAFQVGAFLGEWWRAEVDEDLTPFLPPHVSRPKERMRVFQVELSPFCNIRIPPGASIAAVPLFALTPERVGLCLSGLTFVLAIFNVKMMFAATGKELDLDALDSQEEEEPDAGNLDIKPEAEVSALNSSATAFHADNSDSGKLPPELQRLADLEELQ